MNSLGADAGVRNDQDLLALARAILESEDYVVEAVDEKGLEVLVGENRYFIVSVVAVPTIAQLLIAEGIAERFLTAQMEEADLGPKVWDAYLILLTQERLPDGGEVTRDLFAINYDTRAIRRIAHSGVDPTLSAVRTALTPFVKPIELDDPEITRDPFELFSDALIRRGVEPGVVSRAIPAFKQGADLDDAL